MEQDIRPPTSSTSSQSAIHAEWDPTGQSYYGSRANVGSDLRQTSVQNSIDSTQTSSEIDDLNLEPDEFWPRSDSGDDSEEDGGAAGVLKRPDVNNQQARRNTNTFVVGMDIEPIKPPYSLPNCRFKVADFTEKWTYDFKFDFIHLRHLGNLPSEDVIASIYENLSPGGWAEFTEWVVNIQSTRTSFTETSFYRWLTYWKAGKFSRRQALLSLTNSSLGLDIIGTTVYYPFQYKRLLTEAGFKNVTERKYAVPVNPWPPGKSLQKMGTMMAMNINIILEPMSMPIFIKILGWSQEDIESLLTEVRKEIADLQMHAYMTLLTVYAQKPRESSSGSSVGSLEPG
ncbi:hypothetical protein O1611_g329 [Lasiodiplodia mahajangana]|uniref:Uncharacterized protein n=1 Tax=Lasiodiplodia mahajangana TaxID=1108764 RepID=A0ACC2K176_9PEZI|nr:hypothetical protein O1611_g329 [Lasiodiplodia mahajangana]